MAEVNTVWSHGGSCGDILAHLTPLKDLWKQHQVQHEFYINRNCHPHWRQSEQTIRSLLTLIEVQPYIAKCGIADDYLGVNLDHLFRHPWMNEMNLSDIVHHRLGMHHASRTEPWLLNIEPKKVARVVFHRSPRYHTGFPWKKVVERYGKEAIFVGHWTEHGVFVEEFGPVSYWRTHSFLELAQVIQGATLFVGNQSSPSWVAEGLKKNKVMELVSRDHWAWNCHFERPGFWDNGDNLPDLDELEKNVPQ